MTRYEGNTDSYRMIPREARECYRVDGIPADQAVEDYFGGKKLLSAIRKKLSEQKLPDDPFVQDPDDNNPLRGHRLG